MGPWLHCAVSAGLRVRLCLNNRYLSSSVPCVVRDRQVAEMTCRGYPWHLPVKQLKTSAVLAGILAQSPVLFLDLGLSPVLRHWKPKKNGLVIELEGESWNSSTQHDVVMEGFLEFLRTRRTVLKLASLHKWVEINVRMCKKVTGVRIVNYTVYELQFSEVKFFFNAKRIYCTIKN